LEYLHQVDFSLRFFFCNEVVTSNHVQFSYEIYQDATLLNQTLASLFEFQFTDADCASFYYSISSSPEA
jgi:hypothetical protein